MTIKTHKRFYLVIGGNDFTIFKPSFILATSGIKEQIKNELSYNSKTTVEISFKSAYFL